MHRKVMHSPIGRLMLEEEDGALVRVAFEREIPAGIEEQAEELPLQAIEVLEKAERQLDEYFAGERKVFNLPLAPKGTEFQKKVWAALCDIPYGETRSYGQIAAAVGNPKASRAVGMANHRNPISIIVPCHRVIGADGRLVGFGGGLWIKERLLKLEKENS